MTPVDYILYWCAVHVYYIFQTKHPRKLALIKDSAVELENYVWIIIYTQPDPRLRDIYTARVNYKI